MHTHKHSIFTNINTLHDYPHKLIYIYIHNSASERNSGHLCYSCTTVQNKQCINHHEIQQIPCEMPFVLGRASGSALFHGLAKTLKPWLMPNQFNESCLFFLSLCVMSFLFLRGLSYWRMDVSAKDGVHSSNQPFSCHSPIQRLGLALHYATIHHSCMHRLIIIDHIHHSVAVLHGV